MHGNATEDEPELLVSVDEMMAAAAAAGAFVTFLALINLSLLTIQSFARYYHEKPFELFFVWCLCERRHLSKQQYEVDKLLNARLRRKHTWRNVLGKKQPLPQQNEDMDLDVEQ